MENGNVVHQDDDGFESLNGNVSSDNEREVIAPTIENKNENLEGKANVVELTEQEYSLSRRFSGRTSKQSFNLFFRLCTKKTLIILFILDANFFFFCSRLYELSPVCKQEKI